MRKVPVELFSTRVTVHAAVAEVSQPEKCLDKEKAHRDPEHPVQGTQFVLGLVQLILHLGGVDLRVLVHTLIDLVKVGNIIKAIVDSGEIVTNETTKPGPPDHERHSRGEVH